MMARLWLSLGQVVLFATTTAAVVCDVHDYHAVDDNRTLNTVAIQAAIDACSITGGTVLLKRQSLGVFLSGSLFLKVR